MNMRTAMINTFLNLFTEHQCKVPLEYMIELYQPGWTFNSHKIHNNLNGSQIGSRLGEKLDQMSLVHHNIK